MTVIHSRRLGAALIGFLGLALLSSTCLQAEAREQLDQEQAKSLNHQGKYAHTRQSLEKLIRRTIRQRTVIGLSIALVDDQTVVWSQGFGYADQANGIKATANTLYRAGSVSKLFTATAAMQMAEQGRLDIDEPIQTYLPQFSINTRFDDTAPITPRSMMTHHSGLPEDYRKGLRSREPISELVSKLSDEYVAYPPNFIGAYSNLGVSLLGHIVESACGKPFDTCLKTGLLQSIGMTHSAFSTDVSPSRWMSKGYSQGQETAEGPIRDVPAGGLNTSVLDLSRFVRLVFAEGRAGKHSVVSSDSLAEMLRPQNAEVALDLGQRIGLAWFLKQTATGQVLAGHSGATGLFHSELETIPDQKLGVVVLANSEEAAGVVSELASTALRLMLKEKLGNQANAKFPPMAPAPASLRDYSGYYASTFGLIKLWEENQHFWLGFNGQKLPLRPRADGGLLARIPGIGKVTLTRADLSEHKVLIGNTKDGRMLAGEKISPSPIPAAWYQRLGEYELINPDATSFFDSFQLAIQDGFLIMLVNVAGQDQPFIRVLNPVTDGEAIMAGLGRGLGETIAVELHEDGEVLRYSGLLARLKTP